MRYFYCDTRTGSHIESSAAVNGSHADILLAWQSLSQSRGSFFGIFCESGQVLQFRWDSDRDVIIDIPTPEMHGSFTKLSSFQECTCCLMDCLSGSDPRFIPGLDFFQW
jgi:hypothetical protein